MRERERRPTARGKVMRVRLVGGLTVLLMLAQSCTLVGLGVGSAIRRYEPVRWGGVRRGDDLRVTLRGPTPKARERVHGEVVGTDPLVLRTRITATARRDQTLRARSIPTADDRILEWNEIARIERDQGSYWTMGLGIGLVVDLVGIAVFAFRKAADDPNAASR